MWRSCKKVQHLLKIFSDHLNIKFKSHLWQGCCKTLILFPPLQCWTAASACDQEQQASSVYYSFPTRCLTICVKFPALKSVLALFRTELQGFQNFLFSRLWIRISGQCKVLPFNCLINATLSSFTRDLGLPATLRKVKVVLVITTWKNIFLCFFGALMKSF